MSNLKKPWTPPIPLMDTKFTIDIENGVIFEIEAAKFRDIVQCVNLGKSGPECPCRAEKVYVIGGGGLVSNFEELIQRIMDL